jgi:hypothetical protein
LTGTVPTDAMVEAIVQENGRDVIVVERGPKQKLVGRSAVVVGKVDMS